MLEPHYRDQAKAFFAEKFEYGNCPSPGIFYSRPVLRVLRALINSLCKTIEKIFCL
jgi:hypothetical protein